MAENHKRNKFERTVDGFKQGYATFTVFRLGKILFAVVVVLTILAIYFLIKPAGSYQGYEAGSFTSYYTYSAYSSDYAAYANEINGHLLMMRLGMLVRSLVCLALVGLLSLLVRTSFTSSMMYDEGFAQTHPDYSPAMRYLIGFALPQEIARLHPGEQGNVVTIAGKQSVPLFSESLNFPGEYLLRPETKDGIPGTPVDKAFVDGLRDWIQGSWKAKASVLLNGMRLDPSTGCLVPLASFITVPTYEVYAPWPGSVESRHSATVPSSQAAQQATASPHDGAGVVSAPRPQRLAKFCPGCGAKLLPGTKFCPNCGAKL
jgi:hypothetical protein